MLSQEQDLAIGDDEKLAATLSLTSRPGSLGADAADRIRALSAHVALLKASLAQAHVWDMAIIEAMNAVLRVPQTAPIAEPFGYFRATPVRGEDCAETDEGAIALYERPAPAQAEREAESATPNHEETMNQLQLPALADGETYIGAIGDKNGDAYHLVLLPGDSDPAPLADQIEWAKSIGGDLPNKLEIAMLFANAKDGFKPKGYWTNETFVDPSGPEDDGWAWCQYFYYGSQLYYRKYYELRARAVRRLPI